MQSWAGNRNEAMLLAKTDTDKALAVARAIREPWYKAQSLAWIGFFCKSARFRDILEESRVASWSAIDPYQTVGSSPWRLRAWIERGEVGAATKEAAQLLERADTIEHPVSRLEALTSLLPGVFPLDGPRRRVLDAQIRAAGSAQSWRSGNRLRNSAIILAATGHGDDAARVLAAMPDGPYKRQAMRGIAEAKSIEIRPFFR
jgi:hypothetical protein